MVIDALDEISESIGVDIQNLSIHVEDENPEEPDILGLYTGIPLPERDGYGLLDLPDRIEIYRIALCRMCESENELRTEVRTTVLHEIAHHFGIDDPRLDELGWG